MPRLKDCHYCGMTTDKKTVEQNGGRFCTSECAHSHEDDHLDLRQQLKDNGFTQHPEATNLWTKDGVAISEQEVFNEGMDQTLAKIEFIANNPAKPYRR